MRGIPTPSTDCSSADPSPIFPYRPRPKTTKRSPSLQRKSHISDLAISIARPGSLRPIARIIVAVAQSMCLVAAPMLFELGVCAQTASHTPTIDRFAKFIAEASVRFAVPAFWIRAVIQIESAGDAHSISPRGAMSLMQLMPGTWVELSVLYSLGLDPFDARDNILAGTAYLKEMHDRFGSAGFLAAYHAGPWRYEQHLVTGSRFHPKLRPTSRRTIAGQRQGEHAAVDGRRALPWREAPLFVERAGAP